MDGIWNWIQLTSVAARKQTRHHSTRSSLAAHDATFFSVSISTIISCQTYQPNSIFVSQSQVNLSCLSKASIDLPRFTSSFFIRLLVLAEPFVSIYASLTANDMFSHSLQTPCLTLGPKSIIYSFFTMKLQLFIPF